MLSLRPGIVEELKMTPEDVEWFKHFAHPEKWTQDDCVLWDGPFWREYGGCENQDHGMFVWGADDDVQMMPAHRLAYLLYRGDFGNLLALHKCPGRTNKHKGRCVNPRHISPGTGWENCNDQYKDKDPHYTVLTGGQIRACYEARDRLSVSERAAIYRISEKRVKSMDNGKTCKFITRPPQRFTVDIDW